nr:alpha/beta hydrolase [Pseudalkalibacillus decolorationis]
MKEKSIIKRGIQILIPVALVALVLFLSSTFFSSASGGGGDVNNNGDTQENASTTGVGAAYTPDLSNGANNFYKSNKVTMKKVEFKNLYNMNVVGNLYIPKGLNKNTKHPAIIVGHPMGAVKEQSANLYAQKMAERGFVTLSLDLSFWGESEGQPRNAVSPDIYAEDFSAAVDYLGTQDFIDRERIGVLGICGSGSFVISAAKIDPRMKAIATVSMYNMGAANRNALNHSQTLEQRKAIIAEAAEQRYVEFTGGETKYTSGTVHELNENTGPIQREFYDFYRTPRGEYTPEGSSPELTTHPTLTSNVKFMNFYPFEDIETISPRPMLFITGDQAHSIEFSQDAYKRAAEPKELYIVPGAGHVDLYDRVNLIPFDKLESFFKENLKKK